MSIGGNAHFTFLGEGMYDKFPSRKRSVQANAEDLIDYLLDGFGRHEYRVPEQRRGQSVDLGSGQRLEIPNDAVFTDFVPLPGLRTVVLFFRENEEFIRRGEYRTTDLSKKVEGLLEKAL